MKKYSVTFEIPCYITIEVNSKNSETAMEIASEKLEIKDLGIKEGLGTILGIKGKENTMIIDTDNCYERIDDIREIKK